MSEISKGNYELSPEDAFDYSEYKYNEINAEKIDEIVEDVIARSEGIIDKIVNAEDLTFKNVMSGVDRIYDLMILASGKTSFLAQVHPDAAVREAGFAAEEKMDGYAISLAFREDLYSTIKAYSETDEAASLEDEEARLLENTLDEFKEAGHDLDPEKRSRLLEISSNLSQMGIEFSRNINEDKTVVKVTAEELEGMPESFINELEKDEEGNLLITTSYTHVLPIFDNADNRETRRRTSHAFKSLAKDSNRAILEEAVKIRQEKAEILGQPSWAHHKLKNRMAKTPETVMEFYGSLIEPLTQKSHEEVAVMQEMLRADGFDGPLEAYDVRYYKNKLRENEYGVDGEKVSEYLSLPTVVDGMFEVTGKVFGLEYRELDDPTWHEDVKVYAIDDAETGKQISKFYMDLHPRESKYNHACAVTLVPGKEQPNGEYRQPESAILANFTKPTADKPSLLKHDEVNTLFHEFGHILHQTLTKAKMATLSGTSVERDFVEAPSQIMEHWAWSTEVLQGFAKHHQTGEPIPEELVANMVAAKQLNSALDALRQINFGLIDVGLHNEDQPKDLDQINDAAASILPFPKEEGTFLPASFGHLMGGYDAGYYGYLWSEAYGDDMFEKFETEGLTDPAIGMEYRKKILERGGSVDAIDMLKDFLGREPNSKAFLKNLGIAQAEAN